MKEELKNLIVQVEDKTNKYLQYVQKYQVIFTTEELSAASYNLGLLVVCATSFKEISQLIEERELTDKEMDIYISAKKDVVKILEKLDV